MDVETVEVTYKEMGGVFWYPTSAGTLEALKADGLTPNTVIKPMGKPKRRGLVLYKHLHEAAFSMEVNGEKAARYVLVEVQGVPLAAVPRDGALSPAMFFARSGFILPHEINVLDVVKLTPTDGAALSDMLAALS